MSHAYAPGPGDLLPPFAGHPHDPQCPENNSDDDTEYVIEDIKYFLDSACRAWNRGDAAKAREILSVAHSAIGEILGAAS